MSTRHIHRYLKSGTRELSKAVKIWHTTDGERYEGGTRYTVNGVYSFTGSLSEKGRVVYHAPFDGDSMYGAPSGAVTVNGDVDALDVNPTGSHPIIPPESHYRRLPKR
jgi:hypothetical protein